MWLSGTMCFIAKSLAYLLAICVSPAMFFKSLTRLVTPVLKLLSHVAFR